MHAAKLHAASDRNSIMLPKIAKTNKFLAACKNNIKMPKWKLLDAILEQALKDREDKAIEFFEDFCMQLEKLYPDKPDAIRKIKNLRALILWYYLKNEDVADVYFERLK